MSRQLARMAREAYGEEELSEEEKEEAKVSSASLYRSLLPGGERQAREAVIRSWKAWLKSPGAVKIILKERIPMGAVDALRDMDLRPSTVLNALRTFNRKELLQVLRSNRNVLRVMDAFQRRGTYSWSDVHRVLFSSAASR